MMAIWSALIPALLLLPACTCDTVFQLAAMCYTANTVTGKMSKRLSTHQHMFVTDCADDFVGWAAHCLVRQVSALQPARSTDR